MAFVMYKTYTLFMVSIFFLLFLSLKQYFSDEHYMPHSAQTVSELPGFMIYYFYQKISKI